MKLKEHNNICVRIIFKLKKHTPLTAHFDSNSDKSQLKISFSTSVPVNRVNAYPLHH